jgi:uncharacterized protein (DUF58 family)
VDVALLLDLNPSVQAGQGDDSTEEYGITIAASVAGYLLRQRQLAVGLAVSGVPEGVLQLDRGERQLDRILELLAVVHPQRQISLGEALAGESVHLMRGSVLIVVTPSTELDWPASMQFLLRQGIHPLVIALDAHSFDAQVPGNHRVVEALMVLGVPALTIRNGDNLADALARTIL